MKRLVICADGTWNLRDQTDKASGRRRPTNVTKVARAILPRGLDGTDQVVYYHDGVGTDGGVDKLTGGAFGRGIEDNVRNIYRFLAYNYVPGDEIYLFGFSRGAFTVRTVCGFLNQVGLLQKDDDYFVPEIYGCYESKHPRGSPQWNHAFRKVKDHQPPPPIRMLGVWDTVGALGAPGALGQMFNGKKYQYHEISLNPHIQHAYHALALDEQREAFAPSLWSLPPAWAGEVEQAWFPGVHSNVGGGYALDGLANEALHWMVGKAEALGLAFNRDYLAYFKPCFNSTLNNAKTGMYRAMGTHVRLIGTQRAAGECVHQSVLDRHAHEPSRYAPANLEAYLSGPPLPIVDTERIPRGTPCPEINP
jgi:uncharacterized protein (DUF2235 family)